MPTPPMINRELATATVRAHVGAALSVTEMRPLRGGMCNLVLELVTDGKPASLVAKITPDSQGELSWDYQSLLYFRRHTRFPVPEPIAYIDDFGPDHRKCLLMERLPGRNLAEATLSSRGKARFQQALAGHVLELHGHTRSAYGPAYKDAPYDRWLDKFGPDIAEEFQTVRDLLSPQARETIEKLLVNLPDWLPESACPTLVHGDLWATNIMVDDADPDRPRITGFLDGSADFREVEFELAYLVVFNTAETTFFDHYCRQRPLREGFHRRCRVYWLNTMMLHVRYFGGNYLPACEGLAEEIRRTW